MSRTGRIVILYTDAGGGHRATALALQAILKRKTGYEVTLLNPYRELIADVDLFPRLTGYSDEEVYNRFVLEKGWNNLFCLLYYGLTLLNIRIGTQESARRFCAHWREEEPDLVVSVMPMANQAIYQSVSDYAGGGRLPFLVVITDLQEKMKYTWFPREQDYYVVCGTEQAYRQALSKPHPPELTFRTSGLLVHPAFYDALPVDPTAERVKLGLRADWPTGCMMYGAGGSPRMAQLAEALRGVDRKFQMIFLCGRNQALADGLATSKLPYPHVIRTFTAQVPYYFALSDFLVSKPGPGTISEALVTGLSLLVDTRDALPQERYNVAWIRQNRLGLSFDTLGAFRRAVEELAALGMHMPSGLSRPIDPENCSIFEMPEIIGTVLEASRSRQDR